MRICSTPNEVRRRRASLDVLQHRIGKAWLYATIAIVVVPAACVRQPARPPACCAAPGFSRAQVESVLGQPAPPQSSRWHPFPSPPPDAPIYTTEHGYVTVTYSGPVGLATRISMDFYEGKAPSDAFRLMGAYLPDDAIDTGSGVVGKTANIRVYRSERLARSLPATHGMLYVECKGPQPSLLCNTTDIILGAP